MSVLVVGSVAYDTVHTAFESRENALGGSATYFSIACRYFNQVSVVAVVGSDFRNEDIELFNSQDIDISGLESTNGNTFRWGGEYELDSNKRKSLFTDLNVFADFSPTLLSHHKNTDYLFLANIDPILQLDVIEKMQARPKIIALDSMDFWINGSLENLINTIQQIDILFLDETEIRLLSGEQNLIAAIKKIHSMGPHTIVAKKGEHGVTVFQNDNVFVVPAKILPRVTDPTGAGDAFAGGFMGALSSLENISITGLKHATLIGAVMGSFAVESFSVDRLKNLSQDEINSRASEIIKLSNIETSLQTKFWNFG